MATRNFIGRGWSYPFRFDRRTGGVAKDQGEGEVQQLQRIRMSLRIIIDIKKGELFFNRRFGSRFRDLLWSLRTANLKNRIRFEVLSAFEDPGIGERRAVINRVDVLLPGVNGRAQVEVTFLLRRVNVEGNLVFPFFLTEQERSAAERGLKE